MTSFTALHARKGEAFTPKHHTVELIDLYFIRWFFPPQEAMAAAIFVFYTNLKKHFRYISNEGNRLHGESEQHIHDVTLQSRTGRHCVIE